MTSETRSSGSGNFGCNSQVKNNLKADYFNSHHDVCMNECTYISMYVYFTE